MSENETHGAELKKSFSSELIGTVFLLAGVLVFLSLLSYEPRLVPADGEPSPISNIVGTAGHYTAHILLFLFGHAAHILGPYLVVMGFLYIYRGEVQELVLRLFAALVILIATAVLIRLFSTPGTEFWSAGGVIGRRLGHALEFLFGKYGAIILTVGIFVAGGFLGTRLPFVALLDNTKAFIRKQTTYGAVHAPAPPPAAQEAPPAPEPVHQPPETPPLIQKQPAPPTSPEQQPATGAWDHMSSRPFFEKRDVSTDSRYPWVEYGEEHGDAPANREASAAHAAPAAGQAPAAEQTYAADGQAANSPAPVYHAGESLRISRRALEVADKLRDFQRDFKRTDSPAQSRPIARPEPEELPAMPEPAGARMAPAPLAAVGGATTQSPRQSETGPSAGDFAGHFNYDESRFHFRHAFSGGSAARERQNVREQALYGEQPVAAPGRREPAARMGRNEFPDDRPLLKPLNTSILEEPSAPAKPRGPSGDLNLPEALPVRESFTNHRRSVPEAQVSTFAPPEETEQPADAIRSAGEAFLNEMGGEVAREAPLERTGFGEPDPVHVYAPEDRTVERGTESERALAGENEAESENLSESEYQVENEFQAESEFETESEEPAGEHAGEHVVPAESPYQESEPAVTGVPPLDLGGRKYRLPLEILNLAPRVGHENVAREIELTCARLEVVMRDYGIQAKVVRTQRGPIVTLYEVKLEPGVKVSRILGINDEIKMNLEAPSIRIMAPIPGKPTVGIEIPNKTRETVTLGELARKDREFFTESRNLSIILGKDIAGQNNYVDLTKLPHLLIAGATGAGKSVYMNSIIASLLYTQSPEDVRFIMIDPKMVELTLYEGIPHLLMPVITDVRKASRALAWAVVEMERRYAAFSRLRCRDIRSYNNRMEHSDDPEARKMPYIVILLDELSDLMMVAAKDVEDSIIRLTQKARAVGIHVVMATQRPSVDVITALIKANCPARIAFQVAQRTDSRTILDANGAESLLGSGDMLYKSPTSAGLTRIQSPLLTEGEIEKIVHETRKFGSPNYIEMPGDNEETEFTTEESDVDQELFAQAWKIVQETGKTSTSYIQRRLRIGYNRAARIIEMMEERGFLGPAIGNKPREILKKD